jgi:hypothetical protein
MHVAIENDPRKHGAQRRASMPIAMTENQKKDFETKGLITLDPFFSVKDRHYAVP